MNVRDRCLTMTPGELRSADLEIAWGLHETPFGPAVFATTRRGLVCLEFVGKGGARRTLARLRSRWPRARFVEQPRASAGHARELGRRVRNRSRGSLALVLGGSAFQLKVWRALLSIPTGVITTYGSIASFIGEPRAARAVGTAVGRNPIGYFIPCHRVIRRSGALGGYRWGLERKCAILRAELRRARFRADPAGPGGGTLHEERGSCTTRAAEAWP